MLHTSGISASTADLISLVALTSIVPGVLRIVLVRIIRGTLISHIGVKTGPPVGSISDNLRPTVRKLHSVFAANCLAIARLLSTEIISGSLILHGITELVGLRLKQNQNMYDCELLLFPLYLFIQNNRKNER